ncbi:MAG TPA: AAA family ATPase [Terracidiphilus sp.]|jgi:pilus assembly protein CpaE|nr:AAA family ATPase [Terracidiphilus sp.]HEX4283987.1 AAA family ATPase [Terracidiphilus sp.]
MQNHFEDLEASIGASDLSIALIGPNENRRRIVANALAGSGSSMVREFPTYPNKTTDVPRMLEQNFDVFIIDLDGDQRAALELVEDLAANPAVTVMVFSMNNDPNLLMSCMRSGAREFLSQPVAMGQLTEALSRATSRRPMARPTNKAGGKVLVFLGGKGGSGVTTVACNFAVSLVQECSQTAVLVDLDLPLGDAALNLGITPQFSTVDALQNYTRLDQNFLSKLLTKHSSGLYVLAAPGKFPQVEVSNEAMERMVAVARSSFDFVIVDAGSRFDLSGTTLVDQADTVYLVMQAGIPELRNSHRVISEYFKTGNSNLEIVLNRFMPRSGGVDEEHISKALTRPVQWKIPSDYVTVRRMQNEATPLALEDSMIARAIQDMARTACGMPAKPEKKKGFSLFG